MKTIELLSPAKDADCGIAAVKSGADAVYIGAAKFGARAAAGNGLTDVERLIRFAHRYRARVYIALNTILTDKELPEAVKLAHALYEAGADALIVQDMGLLECDLPPLPLIASTQTNNADWRKVLFLEKAGFERVILARELSLDDIRLIRSKTTVELETFVHGALCVSYSGQCFMSYACYGRSGNRGECAQPCRMAYSLTDADDRTLIRKRYLLSLKDLNLSASLPELIDAGVSSFKIEGRLKDENYIRNVVGYYRQTLDGILEGTGRARPSIGRTYVSFTPDPAKSFSRGFTDYDLHGRNQGVASYYTQKSIGEYVGRVKSANPKFFTYDGRIALHNGDGICFIDSSGELGGTNIETVGEGRVYPHEGRFIRSGYEIYRNNDHDFNKELDRGEVRRKIPVKLFFGETDDGYALKASWREGETVEAVLRTDKKPADKPEQAKETIRTNLTKFGDTQFECEELQVGLTRDYFLPVSELNGLRREAAEKLEESIARTMERPKVKLEKNDYPYPEKYLDYSANVYNGRAREFYRRHGVLKIEPAAETGTDMTGKIVMTTHHCLKYQFGLCAKRPVKPDPAVKLPSGWREPFYLFDGKRYFELKFDCARCVMQVILSDKKPQAAFEKPKNGDILKTDLKKGSPHGYKQKGKKR